MKIYSEKIYSKKISLVKVEIITTRNKNKEKLKNEFPSNTVTNLRMPGCNKTNPLAEKILHPKLRTVFKYKAIPIFL